MKCNRCGAEYEGNFCPECGTRAESRSLTTPPPLQQPTANQQNTILPVDGNAAVYRKPQKPIYKKWWFYGIIALALIAIIITISGGKGKDEKIEWSRIELRAQFPELPSSKGTLYKNSDEKFWASLDGVSDDQYNDYLDACIDKGFTVDADKSSYSYKAYNANGYSLDMSHIGDKLSITIEAPMEFGSITWPSSTVGNMLPAPKSTTGKFSYEHDDSFFVYVGETSRADYDQYVADCSANGFNINYDKGDTYYRADNEDGYHISLQYEGNDIMTVKIATPESGDTGTSEPTTTEPAMDTTEPDELKPAEPSTDTISPSESKTDDTNLVDGMCREFKEAMDSYEAFYTEYCEFMKSYSENPTDLTLLTQYADMLAKADEMNEAFEAWDEDDLNSEELKYYLDVNNRVMQMLVDVAG